MIKFNANNQHHRIQFLSQFEWKLRESSAVFILKLKHFLPTSNWKFELYNTSIIKLKGECQGASSTRHVHVVAAETVRVVRKKLICWLAERSSSVVWGAVGWLDTRHRIASVRQCAEPSPEKWESQCIVPWIGAHFKRGRRLRGRLLNYWRLPMECF